MPFSTLGLRDTIVKALAEVGYSNPTPIQQQTIPVILQGKNLLAAAQTGTGKTASFVLPILERLADTQTQRKKRIRALILTPTRELAVQVQSNIVAYAKYVGVSSFVIYGGVDEKPQKQALLDGVDILVATPGRLLDLYTQRAVHFDELEVLVLDEADRMLDMGFIEDINKIIDKLPSERQSLLFSATLSNQVRALAKTAIHRPVEISVIADKSSAPKISQWLTTVDKDKKSALLSHLIKTQAWDQALIFIETKQGAAKLVSQLEKRDIEAECIHSGRSQPVREQILADFKSGKIQYLVATGIASRGIDIDDLSRVINYDLPYPADDYIHRIGRTGRAGAVGEAISFVSKDDFKNLCMIESRLGHLLERKVIDGFEPKKPVPESILNYMPKSRQNKSKTQDERPTLSLGKSKSDSKDFRKAKTQKAPVKKGPKPNPWNL
ncbi:RNA helicase [Shewanella algicola]|uniref:DEAD-box ATP-dependent RNA helicase RhpA n=1 Tax=Shewanella algicola TaxID=640633 RepID=A0A9X1Z5H6_9GAMM|nr:DEAD/DEAH box helicase [Shewanella algicola]MCL1105499.1 DEAD/DEAH box helicase [Shewanella algicola]GGP42051.1 RNA helicase [Shewanella algicola]